MKCVDRRKLVLEVDMSKKLEEICEEYHAKVFEFIDQSVKEMLEPFGIEVTNFLRGTDEERNAVADKMEDAGLELEIVPFRTGTGKWITRVKLFRKDD